jgi:PhnB protein
MPSKATKPIPQGYHSVTPYLIIRDAARAIDFYKKAFGAVEKFRMAGPDGKIGHAEIQIGDSMIMISDENPQWGTKSPQALGGTPVSIFLYVPDVDATFKQAVSAGAKETMAVSDQFWGDRYGKVADPFGHTWNLATHKEDLTPAEIEERAKKFFAQGASSQG